MISKFLEENHDEILKNICELIKIPSVSLENEAKPGMPFGKNCQKALEYVLNLAKEMGFRTKNIDGYCGYVEFGDGEEMLGIVGHLDVVPAGDGWTKCEAFSPVILENRLYGRGAIDDKGPVIASLYAMKYIKDTMNVNKRVRLILGLNEEVSWKCIDYYKSHEELPTIGFSPDADFPCIYAEKGFLNCYVNSNYYGKDSLYISELNCENAMNMVPKFSTATIVSTLENLDQIFEELSIIINDLNFHIDIKKLDDYTLSLSSNGVQAHSAFPDLGINSLSRLLIVLNRLFDLHNISILLLKFVDEKIGIDLYGEKLNINCEDESGKLTLNVSNIKYENNAFKLGLNIRIPVTIYPSIIKEKINETTFDYSDLTTRFADEKDALYVPKNDYLVSTLCDIFNEVTHKNAEPLTCSGATYARAFKNMVSFGANMPGNMDMCHQADEYIKIDDLFTSINIYIRAIRKLTE